MKTNGPWKIKDSQEKYKNLWVCVREDHVVRPDGKDGIFGVVEIVAGISVLPLDNEGFVYLTNEFHYAIEQDSIEVVSGAIDKDEKSLEAAKRELKEELGGEARVRFEEALKMVMRSEITHGPSCVLILKAAEYLRTHT